MKCITILFFNHIGQKYFSYYSKNFHIFLKW